MVTWFALPGTPLFSRRPCKTGWENSSREKSPRRLQPRQFRAGAMAPSASGPRITDFDATKDKRTEIAMFSGRDEMRKQLLSIFLPLLAISLVAAAGAQDAGTAAPKRAALLKVAVVRG